MINSILKKYIAVILILSATIFIIHFSIIRFSFMDSENLNYWWVSYVFLVPVTILGLVWVIVKYGKTKKITSIGKNYILYTVIKMVGTLIFLLPWLLFKDETSKPMVFQFFAIFFPFLLVETILLVRLLKTPLDEKIKNEQNQL